ncbi:hypothetical protein EV673_2867 [Limnobacter thiooxidans]|nr:hypothetical protein EV673_2867 [Limnobacter thiooxidans]
MTTPTVDQLKLQASQLVKDAQKVDAFPIKELAGDLARLLLNATEIPEHYIKEYSIAIQKVYRQLNLVCDNKPALDHLSDAVLEFYFSPIASQHYLSDSESESGDKVAPEFGAKGKEKLADQVDEMNSPTGSKASPPVSPKARCEAYMAFLNSSAGVMTQSAIRNAISQLDGKQVDSLLHQLRAASSNSGSFTAFPALSPQNVRDILDHAGIDKEGLAADAVSLLARSPIRSASLQDQSGLFLKWYILENPPVTSKCNRNSEIAICTNLLHEIPKMVHERWPDLNERKTVPIAEQVKAEELCDFVNEAFGWEEGLSSNLSTNAEAIGLTRLLFDHVADLKGNANSRDTVDALAARLFFNPAVVPNSKLKQAFLKSYSDLVSKFGDKFSEVKIQDAVVQSLRYLVRSTVIGSEDESKPGLQNQFLAQFILCLKHGKSTQPSHISPEKVNDLVKTLTSKQVLSEKGGFLPVDVLGKVDVIVFNPPPVLAREEVKKSQQVALPETNANMPLMSQSGERFRVHFISQTLSGPMEELEARINSSKVSLIHADSATKRVADAVVVSKPEGAREKLAYKLNDPKKQRLVDVEMKSVVTAVASGKETGHVANYLQGFFKGQLANCGVDLRRYDRVAYRSVHSSSKKLRLSDNGADGLVTNGLLSKVSPLSLEEKAFKRAEDTSKKRFSGLVKRGTEGGNIPKKWDRAFVNYMTYRQSLWKFVKPEAISGALLSKHADRAQVDFPLLEQIGFNQRNLSRESLIKMGQLVVSAVGAETFRKKMSSEDVDGLYRNLAQVDGNLPLSANDFASNLLGGEGKKKPDGTWSHGTLGSQVIDCIAELNRDLNAPLLAHQHQMMGNLLSLMMEHAYRQNGDQNTEEGGRSHQRRLSTPIPTARSEEFLSAAERPQLDRNSAPLLRGHASPAMFSAPGVRLGTFFQFGSPAPVSTHSFWPSFGPDNSESKKNKEEPAPPKLNPSPLDEVRVEVEVEAYSVHHEAADEGLEKAHGLQGKNNAFVGSVRQHVSKDEDQTPFGFTAPESQSSQVDPDEGYVANGAVSDTPRSTEEEKSTIGVNGVEETRQPLSPLNPEITGERSSSAQLPTPSTAPEGERVDSNRPDPHLGDAEETHDLDVDPDGHVSIEMEGITQLADDESEMGDEKDPTFDRLEIKNPELTGEEALEQDDIAPRKEQVERTAREVDEKSFVTNGGNEFIGSDVESLNDLKLRHDKKSQDISAVSLLTNELGGAESEKKNISDLSGKFEIKNTTFTDSKSDSAKKSPKINELLVREVIDDIVGNIVKQFDIASNKSPIIKTNEDKSLNAKDVPDAEKPLPVFNSTLDLWDEFKENDWLDASEIHSEIDRFFEDYESADSALIAPVRVSVHASLDKLLVQRMPTSTGKPGRLMTEFVSFLFQDEEFIKAWGDFSGLPVLTIKKDLQKKKIILEKGKANLNEWFKTMVAEIKESHKEKVYLNKMKKMLSPIFDKTPKEYSSEFKDEVKDLLVNEIIETQGKSKSSGLFWIQGICKNLRLSIKNNNSLKKEIILLAGKDLKLETEIALSPLAQFESDKKQVVENFMKVLDTELPALFSTNGSLDPDSIRVYKKGG